QHLYTFIFIFFIIIHLPLRSTLFPYTTLFRSILAFGNKKNILMGQKGNGEIGYYASFKADESWAANSGLDFSDTTQLLEWFKNEDRKSTRLNSSHVKISYAVFCLKKKKNKLNK